MKIEKLGDNIFIFKFRNEAYLKRILTGGPWHISQALIVLKEPEGIGEISSHLFTHATFWIQIKNVLIKCMGKEICTGMGKLVDKIEEVDTDGAGDYIHTKNVISTKGSQIWTWLKALSWAEKAKKKRAKERWNTRTSKGDEMKTQDDGRKLSRLQRTQSLSNEPEELGQ
ncbi:hypothetical protein WN944_015373 [Citrus x changshan-huyou]|uniref:DUF4283 domain-containing protein n=1 Tax=Citrus x changshan-huyou TaxID=2935761 RepID=A0AAP0M8Y5_9ROSI